MILDEKEIKDSWKEYMEVLMNEENEWEQQQLSGQFMVSREAISRDFSVLLYYHKSYCMLMTWL